MFLLNFVHTAFDFCANKMKKTLYTQVVYIYIGQMLGLRVYFVCLKSTSINVAIKIDIKSGVFVHQRHLNRMKNQKLNYVNI